MANEQNLTPWEEGESGNPEGRPKGSRNIATRLKELMQVAMSEENPMTGQTKKAKAGDLIYAQLIAKAAKNGDMAAIKEIFDRLEGKAVAKTEDVTERSFMDNLRDAKKDDNK